MPTDHPPPQHPIAIGAAFRFAWRALWVEPQLFVGLLLAIVGCWGLLEVLVIGAAMPPGRLDHLIFHIGFFWASSFFEAGLVRLALNLETGAPTLVRDVLPDVKGATRFFAAKMIVLPLALVGFALLIVPGLYVIARFGLFGFFVVEHGLGPLQALRAADRAGTAVRKRLMGLAAVLTLLGLAGAALLGLGLIVTVPLTVLVMAFVYRRLTQPGSQPTHTDR